MYQIGNSEAPPESASSIRDVAVREQRDNRDYRERGERERDPILSGRVGGHYSPSRSGRHRKSRSRSASMDRDLPVAYNAKILKLQRFSSSR